jgi:hypothetical protein
MSVSRSNPRKLSPSRNNHVLRDSPKTADFDPRNMKTPLAVWCRSDLGAELNGATVSKWLDMSGNGRDFSQSTAGDQPTFGQSGLGQRPELSWDDDRMTGSDLYAMLADKGEWTIFVVMGHGWQDSSGGGSGASGSYSNSPNVLTANPSIGYVGICILSANRGGFGGGIFNSGYKESIPETAGKIGQGDPAIFALYSDSGGIKSRQNGVDGTTGTAADLVSTATTIQIGDAADNNNADDYYDGPLSEVMIFDGTLDSGEFRQVEQYLADRYDVRLNG